jgi:hypothetical protein
MMSAGSWNPAEPMDSRKRSAAPPAPGTRSGPGARPKSQGDDFEIAMTGYCSLIRELAQKKPD